MRLNPCDDGCFETGCPYGVNFYKCPKWLEWKVEYDREEAEQEDDD